MSIEDEIFRQIKAEHDQQIRNAKQRTGSGILQAELDKTPPRRRETIVIAAVDANRGFSKDGKIPWHHPEDFRWFRTRTEGQICIMGRKTYEDINARQLKPKVHVVHGNQTTMGRYDDQVLPGRTCFVVSDTLKDIANATVVKSIYDVETHLPNDDDRPQFIIGGEKLFLEGISMASLVLLTIVNDNFECDKFFPVEYLMKHFDVMQMFKVNTTNDLRFTVWQRKQ